MYSQTAMSMEKIKYILNKALIVIVILLLCLIPVFLLVKTFWLNRPTLSPFEVCLSYLQLEQKSSQRKRAERYLFDFQKVEIFGERYPILRNTIWAQKEKKGKEPVFEKKEEKIGKEKARVRLLEKTNRNEGLIFFDFKLPKEVVFEIELKKEGSWKKGYQWKIIRIDSPTLISEGKIGEEKEIEENVFVKPIKIEEYMPSALSPEVVGKLPENLKSLTLEIEYRNNSNSPVGFYPFSEWRIVDEDGKEYIPPSQTSARVLREPIIFGGELKPKETKRGYIPFEVPKDFSVEKIIFKNMKKKVIFSLNK